VRVEQRLPRAKAPRDASIHLPFSDSAVTVLHASWLTPRHASRTGAYLVAWGRRAVPIRPFLDGEYFEQELIGTMSEALADACTALGLKDKDDPAVRFLAKRIVDEARAGVHDRSLLKAAAIKGLGPATKH
jgi:hypothetical protein